MAKPCKTITISNCPPSGQCITCKEIVKTDCIKYTGSDLTIINVTEGDRLTTILENIDNSISDINDSLEDMGCNCPTAAPQACVKTVPTQLCINPTHSELPCPNTGFFSEFFSCSTSNLPEGCSKSYKIFDGSSQILTTFSTLDEVNSLYDTWLTLPEELLHYGKVFSLVEYITCTGDATESLPVYFELGIRNTSNNPSIKANLPEIVLVDSGNTDIKHLGTITYDLINAESGTEIFVNFGKSISTYEFVEAYYLTVDESFDIGIIDSSTVTSTLDSMGFIGYDLADDTTKLIHPINNSPGIMQVINDYILYIKYDVGGGEVNPQNLTQGAITLKAKVKKFPI